MLLTVLIAIIVSASFTILTATFVYAMFKVHDKHHEAEQKIYINSIGELETKLETATIELKDLRNQLEALEGRCDRTCGEDTESWRF